MYEEATITDIAYAAGFFDGEGSLAVYKGSGYNRKGLVYAVSVWQNNEMVLDWLKDTFGGGTYNRKNTANEWRVTGSLAYAFLRIIQPFLIVRCQDVEEMVNIYQHRLDGTCNELIAKRKVRLQSLRSRRD